MKSVNQLVKEIKEDNSDFEFYPTTQEIVSKIYNHIKGEFYGISDFSFLDVGCGNGNVFQKLKDIDEKEDGRRFYFKFYGIEINNILAEQLGDDIILLGSDFYTNTIIDKKVSFLFCNPPYSDFENWADRLIREGNFSKAMYLVIPSRWQDSKRIKESIEKRELQCKILGTYDFIHAERKARAKVDLIAFESKRYTVKDPFDLWFDETFSINADKQATFNFASEKETEVENELVASGNTVDMLLKFYERDLQQIYDNYKALEKLDSSLFMELKINIASLKESLKKRLQDLKSIYWDLLFKKYNSITSRLTSKVRDRIVKRLNSNVSIDFTADNIYNVTMWVIKHSNKMFDEQISDFFFSLCNTDNIHRYKSNKRWSDDDWRYLKQLCTEYRSFSIFRAKENLKNFMLDYRIIATGWSNFEQDFANEWRLRESCIDFLYDMSVVAKNFGYNLDFEMPDRRKKIELSDWQNMDIYTREGELFCNLKLYKNGNRHIKFNQDFMKKLNVEMARINGWIQDKSDAEKELGLKEGEIERLWNANAKIGLDSIKTLGITQIA